MFKFMELNLKSKSAQIVFFSIAGVLIISLLFSLVIKGKEVVDILERNYYSANSIAVNGEGKIKVMPDVAYAGYNMEVKNKDMQQAAKEIKEKTKTFLSFLFEQGIPEENIWLLNYNVFKNSEIDPLGKEFFTYQITQTINVKIKDKEKLLEKINLISDKAMREGLLYNSSSCCSCGSSEESRAGFYIDNPEEYYKEATRLAIEDAKKQAREQANLMGFKLGGLVSSSDFSDDSTACNTANAVEILNKIEIKKNISVNFEVKR